MTVAKVFDLARMTTATSGTGTITLGAAVPGYLSFANAGASAGDVVFYGIKDGNNSEVGIGTYGALGGTTLTRTPIKSTNGNAAISLSGNAEVFITPTAEGLTDAANLTGNLSITSVVATSSVTTTTMTATLVYASAASYPQHNWTATGNGTDLKYWRSYSDPGGTWTLDCLNDAGTAAAIALTITRSGVTPNLATWSCNVNAPGYRAVLSAFPKFIWEASGNGTDLKKFQAYVVPTSGDFAITTLNDAENAVPAAWTFSRNGTFSAINGIFSNGIQLTYQYAGVEYGSTSIAGTPYFDGHSSGFGRDFDGRIIWSGGSSTADGTGAISIYATSGLTVGGSIYAWSVSPAADNTYTLGGASLRFTQLYATTATINTSDAREKTAVVPMTDAEIAAAKDLAREIGTFKYLRSITEKGKDKARTHVGMTVQRAMEIMTSHGLDPLAYGFICHDAWDAVPGEAATYFPADHPIKSKRGKILKFAVPGKAAGELYGFRPDQLTLFIARGFEARLAALEAKA